MKRLLYILLLLPFIANAQLMFSTGFEQTNVNQYIQNGSTKTFPVEQGTNTGVTKSNVYKQNGTYSAMFDLQRTDPNSNVGSKRSEIVPIENANAVWYTWVDWFDPTYWDNDTKEEVFVQWHDRSSACSASPPLSLETINGNIRVRTRYSTANYCTNSNSIVERAPVTIGPVLKGVPIKWIVYYKVGFANDGIIEIWRDHVQGQADQLKMISVFRIANVPTNYIGANAAVYWKLGIYKWVWAQSNYGGSTTTRRRRYVDDLAVYGPATTIDDLIPQPVANKAPVINVGSTPVNLPAGTTTFTRTATDSDSDGVIVNRGWTRQSGPNVPTMSSGNGTQALTLFGLVAGTYNYQYKVTDDKGATTIGTLVINVAASSNVGPSVDITGPTSPIPLTVSFDLTSDISDSDGTISTILWEQLEGPPSTIVSKNSQNTQVGGAVPGTYLYKVTATDDDGASASQTITVTISFKGLFTISKGTVITYQP